MSVLVLKLTAILVALQHILVSDHRHFCVYTDSMSALESLHSLTERRHPTVMEILLLLRKLERKGFDIIFCWVPGHVGILGNEQADNAARSLSDHMQQPVCYHDLKASIQRYIHSVWQETWDQQVINKLHYIHPFITHWTAVPIRRPDVCLTRLRIGHTRLTHRHLLLGESPPVCDFCHCDLSILHILIECPNSTTSITSGKSLNTSASSLLTKIQPTVPALNTATSNSRTSPVTKVANNF
ncbi:putative RNA-directed DNA polymerase from transposon X-element [Trichonephila clavata]|uniref:Putative RNA-directed DNA polymerase from transposon X-element n=1 Tax=Trichonephila clavata TaxID=2740835 RepID=A0A8X6GSM5_TRICU|nr:putative RNA-directed DNA polymerase from transposon X-element [Trichonephila clavata]